jgi:short-subunit dehydrogenase
MTHIDKNRFGPWAIVTGASSGIGKEFARQLAASGLNVVLVARRLLLLEEVGHGLAKEFGVQYRAVGVDLSDEGFLETLAEATRDLDVGLVVSNAGATVYGDFLTLDRTAMHRSLRLNVTAHLHLIHHYGRGLAQRGRGGVILVSSMAGLQGTPYMTDYAAAKAYVLSLGAALHVEFQKRGLYVTVLLPGPTDTPMMTNSGTDPSDTPMKLMSAQECVAEGLAALNADRATHIAGRLNRIMLALIPRSVRPKMMGAMVAKGLARREPQAEHIG